MRRRNINISIIEFEIIIIIINTFNGKRSCPCAGADA